MNKYVKKLLLTIVFSIFFFGFVNFLAKADNCDASCQLRQIQDQINQYQGKINALKVQSNTLSNQIAQFDAQIRLAELKIQETEGQISLLVTRIDQLQGSLDSLSNAYEARVKESYKMGRVGEPILILITAPDLDNAVTRFHYLRKLQEADHNLLIKLASAQKNYKKDKTDFEVLKKNLQNEKDNLDSQKAAKSNLLSVTRNDEAKYQQLLQSAQAELEAIQTIISGQGVETQVGHVNEGDKIASIIVGLSACSSGTHLHFQVSQSQQNQNPANFLIPKSIIWDNKPDGPFSFGGSWQWPVNDPIRITQGYGMTYYAKILNYYGGAPHTGIDMLNDNGDLTVKAVKNGTLYRGGVPCKGDTLRYVHVHNDDAGLDTFYLHVNY